MASENEELNLLAKAVQCEVCEHQYNDSRVYSKIPLLPVDDTEKDIDCSTEVTLKTAANPWKRLICRKEYLYPDQDIELLEVERNVRSILNKLTPQKFKTLIDTFLQLKIDNVKKLERTVDLIFEKSISEPKFSVCYANMCLVPCDYWVGTHDFRTPLKQDERQTDGKGQVTFKKFLLNKCQKEFEKVLDEKLLEQNRSKEFANEEERKAWKEELDHREMMNRKRMLGNIRFIGELFKLKIISENIMHDCILKLLRAEKQDSLEDQLECLCKLLSTIGKDLDHSKAKPRMDQYFSQINKIIEKKKISSRIKFVLQDVIDLRSGGWVPRRDDGNPKTIDQIHREAQQKEKQEEIARQQDKLQRSNRGGDRRDRDRGDGNRDIDWDRELNVTPGALDNRRGNVVTNNTLFEMASVKEANSDIKNTSGKSVKEANSDIKNTSGKENDDVEECNEPVEPVTWLSKLPSVVLEEVLKYLDSSDDFENLYEADEQVKRTTESLASIKAYREEIELKEEVERERWRIELGDSNEDYSDYYDDYDDFTPHDGYYQTGDGDMVYCFQGGSPDYTACSSECGYCGRCDY